MPNWCDLDVTIIGDKEVLEQIKAKGAEGTFDHWTEWDKEKREYTKCEKLPNVFSFDNFFPVPKFDESKEDKTFTVESKVIEWSKGREGNFDNWYDWCIGNWGTKWDLDQLGSTSVGEITEREDGLYQFGIGGSTAWAPALNLFGKITEDYPVKVVYRYAEEGMNFFGQAIIENGNIEDDCREISSEDYVIAGATLDSDGNVDWDLTDEYYLFRVFDLEDAK